MVLISVSFFFVINASYIYFYNKLYFFLPNHSDKIFFHETINLNKNSIYLLTIPKKKKKIKRTLVSSNETMQARNPIFLLFLSITTRTPSFLVLLLSGNITGPSQPRERMRQGEGKSSSFELY